MRHLWSLFLVLFALPSALRSQDFHSVKAVPADRIIGQPVIRMQSDDKILFSFDEWSIDARNLDFKIVHCQSDGKASGLDPIHFISGNIDSRFQEMRFSLNTRKDYTYYELLFPQDGCRMTHSGNYLLCIYDTDDPENILLEIPFQVCEEKIDIQGKAIPPRRVEFRRSQQELELELTCLGNFEILQPYQNLKVQVQQNGRIDDIRLIQPQYVVGKTLKYNSNDALIFDGGNEFRNFDSKFLDFNSTGVETIDWRNDGISVYLIPALPRTTKTYNGSDDINGQWAVQANKKIDSRSEAEYTDVFFSLKTGFLGENTDVYIFGELSRWQIPDSHKMIYDFKNQAYVQRLAFKQGFYDYAFAVVEKGKINLTRLEGNHQETRNEYHIRVYYQGPADRAERLVAYKIIHAN